MRVIGIDPSSSFCGTAVIDTPDTIKGVDHWERNKNRSHPQGFEDYFKWLGNELWIWKPQMAVIEFHAYTGPKSNAQATQAVNWYQSVSALCCKLNGLIVIETRASSARKATLGNGGLSKDKVWEIMRSKYPDLFSPKTRGGLDESDALVLALAGERVSER